MLPRDLDDWLTEEGDKVVRKAAAGGLERLDPKERLLYEVWLFDTEQRNGGVSQYFCNEGKEQWQALCALAAALPAFASIESATNSVIAGADDPYEAVIASGSNLDNVYRTHCEQLISQLRARAGEDPGSTSKSPKTPR